MDPNTGAAREPLTAKVLEHSLTGPTLTNESVAASLEAARRSGLAAVAVRPCDVDLAVRLLEGSAVKVGSVAGFPHGTSNTAGKLYEARDLLRRGAKEIDVVVNYARLLSREFQSVQTELLQMSEACRKEGAVVKVTLEVACLTAELKIVACQCCERADVNVVKAATGFGPEPDTLEDLRLLRENLPDDIAVEPGPVATLDALVAAHAFGCDRVGVTDPDRLLAEWKERLHRRDAGTPSF